MANTNYQKLIESLIREKFLYSSQIIKAFKDTPRIDYLPNLHKSHESLNAPLPLYEGQTTSQPLTIAFMLELLNPQPGNRVLEIGYGSGWQTAILSKIICPEEFLDSSENCGEIFAYEIVPRVSNFGKKNIKNNLSSARQSKIYLSQKDYMDEFENNKPYDRIIAGASFDKVPEHLIKSLTPEGIMVYPTAARDIRKVVRKDGDKYIEETFPGFVFVPITHAK